MTSEPVSSESILSELSGIVNGILRNNGRSEVGSLRRDQHLMTDLGLESLDLAEFTVLVEQRFGVDVFADGIVMTVSDVLGRLGSETKSWTKS